MKQDVFPEIEAAAESVRARIAIAEKEIADMKAPIKAKTRLLRSWRKALVEFACEPCEAGKAANK